MYIHIVNAVMGYAYFSVGLLHVLSTFNAPINMFDNVRRRVKSIDGTESVKRSIS